MCLSIKRKGTQRENVAHLAIWIFLGFTSYLLVLMANAVNINFSYVDDVLISLAYGYFMNEAAIFNRNR